MLPSSKWSKITHHYHLHIPAAKEERGAFLYPMNEQSGCSTHPFHSHPIGQELVVWPHLTAREIGKFFFLPWVVMQPAKNCISREAGERQSEGVGCDGCQVFGSLLEVSHPTRLHPSLSSSSLSDPHISSPVPHTALPDFVTVFSPDSTALFKTLLVLLFSCSLPSNWET